MQTSQDKTELSFGRAHPLVADAVAAFAPDLLQRLYLPVADRLTSQSKDLAEATEQQKIVKELLDQIRGKGYTVSSEHPLMLAQLKETRPLHAAVDLFNNKAFIPKDSNPGTVAHELGHILGPKLLGKIQFPGKIGGSLAYIASLFRSDKDKAKRDSLIASGILGATLLPSEIDASIRGYKALGALDKTKGVLRPQLLSRLSRMRSFAGLPTYALATMAPFMTYKLREGFGSFENKK